MWLNEKYNVLCFQNLNTVPLPSLSRAYALASYEERQQLVTASRSPSVEAAAFSTGNVNRIKGDHKPTGNRDPSKQFCEYCKKTKYTQDNCFKLHGYPEWQDKGKKSSKPKLANNSQHMEMSQGNNTMPINRLTNEQYAQLISTLNLEKTCDSTVNFASKVTSLSNSIIEQVPDSRDSDHMTCQKSIFTSLETMPNFSPIKTPDGTFIPAKSYGDISLDPRYLE